MNSAPHIWVQTSFFQVDSGEDGLTNPGIYGRALANWLAEKLRSRQEPVQQIISEDWGWCVMLSRKPYALWVGCSNRNGRTDEWGVFVAAEPNFIQRLLGRADAKLAVARVYKLLHEIMHEVPGATKIWVEENERK